MRLLRYVLAPLAVVGKFCREHPVVPVVVGAIAIGVIVVKLAGGIASTREIAAQIQAERVRATIDSCRDRNKRWHGAFAFYQHLPRSPGQPEPHTKKEKLAAYVILEKFTDNTVGPIRPCRQVAINSIRAGK